MAPRRPTPGAPAVPPRSRAPRQDPLRRAPCCLRCAKQVIHVARGTVRNASSKVVPVACDWDKKTRCTECQRKSKSCGKVCVLSPHRRSTVSPCDRFRRSSRRLSPLCAMKLRQLGSLRMAPSLRRLKLSDRMNWKLKRQPGLGMWSAGFENVKSVASSTSRSLSWKLKFSSSSVSRRPSVA
jgi:hypothetical protein